MKDKWIAGVVLCSLFVWADIPAWSGEMVAVQSPAATDARVVHETHASAAHHACCPSLKSNAVLQVSPLGNPCGEQHRCCFSRGPAFPLSLPVSSERVFTAEAISQVECAKAPILLVGSFTSADASRPHAALNMVLRI